jgi:hypothetical protein
MPEYDHWNNDPSSHPIYKTWISLSNKEAAGGYSSLAPAERVFYGVYLLDLEVYNGGFLQYFGNTEGEHTGDLVASLAAIGAAETAARVEQFLEQVFPGGVPDEAVARRGLAVRLETDYDQFRSDEEILTDWYCQDKDTIFDRLQKYAREHGFLVE